MTRPADDRTRERTAAQRERVRITDGRQIVTVSKRLADVLTARGWNVIEPRPRHPLIYRRPEGPIVITDTGE
jgi:hypothetical protein